ncbi:hypothetical protein [Citrobacter portucalensis]|uniref:hypothetical protein n=1 Tax=Citrobacter portucalensis TaxID=1639133 RepID=UPI0018A5E4C3|nr:hypothetical protein [Citrobacter portucalensis]BBV41358.1 hypothetical protein STW0522CIT26_28300 [Citrobacter portucalensis]BBV46339.1 hypothetical protein STW0522CIT27_27790 [Citrobacter portucalensis]BBV51621.1 hypothetical protein STW0522CIT30_28810 [Citrobacter portucalensis]BBW12353.1 hypothetical protein STN0717CIT27_28290 [Citrobacter portucalensis]BBW17405.1 hypothetical protein STN0717CIT36_28290 [Citrobacter portucalensis]
MTPDEKKVFLFEQAVHLVASLRSQSGNSSLIQPAGRSALKHDVEFAYRILEEKFDSLTPADASQTPTDPSQAPA